MLKKLSRLALGAAVVAGTLAALPAHAGKTIDAIKARGQLVCGVNPSLPGFSAADRATGPGWTSTSARPWLPR
jgi:general L-amino acid transport system substrate-binding protein